MTRQCTLLPDDLEEVLAARPDLLVVGLGAYRRMSVTDEVQHSLKQAGVGKSKAKPKPKKKPAKKRKAR